MVRELNMDTQRQNFWKESIRKEAMVRLAWQTQYSKEFARTGGFGKSRAKKVSIDVEPVMRNLQEKLEIKLNELPDAEMETQAETTKPTSQPKTYLKEMRPASKRTVKVLYEGFSADGGGRYAYLEKRKTIIPERKYEFPITSSFEYGWKSKDAMKGMKPAQYSRSSTIKEEFYRPNGIFTT
jgi:hypothetical protein